MRLIVINFLILKRLINLIVLKTASLPITVSKQVNYEYGNVVSINTINPLSATFGYYPIGSAIYFGMPAGFPQSPFGGYSRLCL